MVGKILLATEVMWFDDMLLGSFGTEPVARYLGRLPLRCAALVDVAKKAGLANGRTEAGVVLALREQSVTILKQWKMRNLLDAVNHAVMPSPNVTAMVSVVVDNQKDCKELKVVRLLFCVIIFYLSLTSSSSFLFSLN